MPANERVAGYRNMKVALMHREDPVPGWVIPRLSELDIKFVERLCDTGEEVIALAADADIVWMMDGCELINADVLAQLTQCQAILRAGSGTDNVPVAEATARGIVVGNTPEAVARTVAEHTIALLLAVSRTIAELRSRMQRGDWDFDWENRPVPFPLLENATLGLIGFGHISRSVVQKLSGFNMTILATRRRLDDTEDMLSAGVTPADLDTVLQHSDYVSVHTPLLESTRHLIGERELRLMQPHAALINTSRGAVVNETALIHALQEGRIAGAGLDVLEKEPLDADNPLLHMDNVVFTPHMAYSHPTLQHDFWDHSVRTIIEMCTGNPPLWQVNPEVTPRWLLNE